MFSRRRVRHACVTACVCVFECALTSVLTHARACVCVRTFVCMRLCASVCVRASMCVCARAHA